MKAGAVHHGYRLERVLGRGSRAVVWEATQLMSNRTFALKVLETTAIGADARFLQEFRAMSSLEHPNVVRVHAFLEIERRLVVVLDRVPGPNLEELLARETLDEEEALRLFGHILRGLRAAHQAGLVHRDLKPSNVLIQTSPVRVARLTDFGEVKTGSEDEASTSGLVLGTIRYMPPEQLQNASNVDARADLFGAGCILFEMLTGTKAFDGPNKIAIMNKVRTGDHTPFPDTLPEYLQEVLTMLLAADRDRRPASADAVLELLGLPASSVETDHPTPMVQPSTPYYHMVLAGLIGALAIVLLLWGGLLISQ